MRAQGPSTSKSRSAFRTRRSAREHRHRIPERPGAGHQSIPGANAQSTALVKIGVARDGGPTTSDVGTLLGPLRRAHAPAARDALNRRPTRPTPREIFGFRLSRFLVSAISDFSIRDFSFFESSRRASDALGVARSDSRRVHIFVSERPIFLRLG